MKKYTFFLSILLVMGLNGGNPCPPNINCNFSLPKLKGMQIREIEILSPKSHTNWEDGMIHVIKWKWVPKSTPKKFPHEISVYLRKANKSTTTKLFTRRAIKGFRPNRVYKIPWKIDTKIYSFPGLYKLKLALNNNTYGESRQFHISQSLHKEVIKIRPHISNEGHYKYGHRHVNVTVDTTGQCSPSTKVPYDTMRVGFENRYKESGIGGVNYYHCSYVYRGYLFFNLGNIVSKNVKIIKAKLHMTRTSPTACATNGTVTNSCNCIREVDYFTQKKIRFNTPAEFYKKLGKNQAVIDIDVSSIVRKIKVNGIKHIGFKFIGINENYSENNNKCVSFYDNIYLELQVLKRGKLPPPPPPR